MKNHTVISGLVKRRTYMMADLVAAQSRVQQVIGDIANLDAVIHQFDPSYPIATIKAKRRRKRGSAGYGAITRAVLDALRRAKGPLTAATLTGEVMLAHGLDATDKVALKNMRTLVQKVLWVKRKAGVIKQAGGEKRLSAWTLGTAQDQA